MSKKTFLATPIAPLSNYVPSVDLGAFDLTLDAKNKRADVLVRVHLLLKDTTSQIPLVRFGERFSKFVPKVWDKRVRFVSTQQGWDDVYFEPRFKVHVTGLQGAHFRIKVLDEDAKAHADGPFAVVTQKEHSDPSNPAFSPRKGRFGAAANQAGEINSYRRNIIYDLSRSPLMIPIKGAPTQDPIGRQRLEKFAREIIPLKVGTRLGQKSRRPTLSIQGCGPGNRDAVAASAKAWLVAAGVKNPITL